MTHLKILVASSNPHKIEEIREIFDAMSGQFAAQDAQARSKADDNDEQPAPVPEIKLYSLEDLDFGIPEPIEDGETFEANAVKKARHYSTASRMLCLADDSGLEVDALGGAPGVYSARYSGLEGSREVVDPANNQKLIDELSDVPAELRTARFVCAMALVTPDPETRILDMLETESQQTRRERANPKIHRSAHVDDITQVDEVLAIARGTIEGRILLPEEMADPTQPWLGRGANGFGYDPLFLVPEKGCTSAELSPADKNAISHRGNASRIMWRTIRHLCRQVELPKQKKKLPWKS